MTAGDISSGVAYAPLYKFEPGLSPVQQIFCFDQQKRNLLALIADHTIEEVAASPIAADIHEFMDKVTREHLRRMPLRFIEYWRSMDTGDEPALARHFPDGYLNIMKDRASKLHVVLTEDEPNVVHVNFRKTPVAEEA